MYRSVAWKSLQKNTALEDKEAVADIAFKTKIELVCSEGGQLVFVDDKNITDQLKMEVISRGAAIVAAQPIIREIMTTKQRQLGKQGQVVMDGRDIGTVVFPQADKKFFLDADPKERGRRRFTELKEKNQVSDTDLSIIIEQVIQRDNEDRNRKIAPLKKARDAILSDTTKLSIDQVVKKIITTINSGQK
jgi:cytidylate kinase